MDSKVLLLTPNTTVVYAFMWLDLKGGPMVMETPPNVLGIIDDFWFDYVADFGNAGPDKGKGGKFLLLPPDYEGEMPEGYFVKQIEDLRELARACAASWTTSMPGPGGQEHEGPLPPLSARRGSAEVNFVNVSMKSFNTLHAQDATFFEEVNEVVQEEPNSAMSSEVLGLLASIGIEKGKPFEPDARMKKILTEAAMVGTAAQRTIQWRARDESFAAYPGSKSWETGFPGGSHEFLRDGVRLIDMRTRFHYYATGITPAMVKPPIGAGLAVHDGLRDSKADPLDGSKTYRLHIPPDVPAGELLGCYDLRHADPFALADRSGLPGRHQHRQGHRDQNADGPATSTSARRRPRAEGQLAADHSRQELAYPLAYLRSAGALVRENLAAR